MKEKKNIYTGNGSWTQQCNKYELQCSKQIRHITTFITSAMLGDEYF